MQPSETDPRHTYDSEREVLRLGRFISAAEQAALLPWAFRMRPFLKNNGPGRNFLRIHLLPEQNALHAAVAGRVRTLVAGRSPHALEPVLTNYLSIITEGGAVQPHTDSAPPGTRHLRCNLFLQMPASGGRPIIGGVPFDIEPCTLLCFFPSSILHSSEAAGAGTERILLSFGLLVPDTFHLAAAADSLPALAMR